LARLLRIAAQQFRLLGVQMKRVLACAVGALLFAGSANAALLDFTDTTAFPNGTTAGSIAGSNYALSAAGGAISDGQAQDGSTCPASLACDRDGLGIGDDEITQISTGESLTITFSDFVSITAIHLLDLFTGQSFEQALITHSGGSFTINASEALGVGLSGYALYAAGAIVTNFLTFSGPNLFGDDGTNDYALAALDVEAVPLPGALPLLLSGIAGLAFASRRRRNAYN
jgi:hypothetical protein